MLSKRTMLFILSKIKDCLRDYSNKIFKIYYEIYHQSKKKLTTSQLNAIIIDSNIRTQWIVRTTLYFLSELQKATLGNKLQRTKIHFCYNMMDSFVDVHLSPSLRLECSSRSFIFCSTLWHRLPNWKVWNHKRWLLCS